MFGVRGYYVETIGDITDEAVQKYINEQAEDSREEDTRRYKKYRFVTDWWRSLRYRPFERSIAIVHWRADNK